jgi:hypothetical protein
VIIVGLRFVWYNAHYCYSKDSAKQVDARENFMLSESTVFFISWCCQHHFCGKSKTALNFLRPCMLLSYPKNVVVSTLFDGKTFK